MEGKRKESQVEAEAWRIAKALGLCISKIVAKYAAYPDVDPAAFQRIHEAIGRGVGRLKAPQLADFRQELRAVASCPVQELLRPGGADDVDTRIAAIAQVVRERTGLTPDLFRELLSGLLSWEPRDKAVVLDALTEIIRS